MFKTMVALFLGALLIVLVFLLELNTLGELDLYVRERHSVLFIGVSILAGSCLIGLALGSTNFERELHRMYCRAAAELEKGPLTRKELGIAIGSESTQVSGESDPGSSTIVFRKCLSVKESALLDRMIYEGKIVERKEMLSLPG